MYRIWSPKNLKLPSEWEQIGSPEEVWRILKESKDEDSLRVDAVCKGKAMMVASKYTVTWGEKTQTCAFKSDPEFVKLVKDLIAANPGVGVLGDENQFGYAVENNAWKNNSFTPEKAQRILAKSLESEE